MTVDHDVALAIATTIDQASFDAVAARAASTLRPAGAFGRLDETAAWLAGWQRTDQPAITRPGVIIFGADHGVAARGVSSYPAEITALMKDAILNGVATSSALAAAAGAELRFVDVGVGNPTEDFTITDAMTEARFQSSWDAGAEAVRSCDYDVLILGELGIGNTTSAAAIAAALLGGGGQAWAGRGTGVDDDGLARKVETVDAGIARLGVNPEPRSVWRAVGGAELVAMAGACVEARRRSIPLVLDGFIATAALLPLHIMAPGILDHTIAGHRSAERGHHRLLEAIGKTPLIELDLRLGEATGALVALPILRQAIAAVLDCATFDEVGLGD